MEDLSQLMAQLDHISKSIPEGNYLKMCNNIKNIHQGLRNNDPPIIDMRMPHVTAPFAPVLTINNDYDEWAENQAALIYMEEQIKIKEKQLKLMKFRRNITETVKCNAVRERAHQLDLRLGSYTVDDLRAKGVRIPDERVFYKSYIERQNILTQGVRAELEADINELHLQIEDIEIVQGL